VPIDSVTQAHEHQDLRVPITETSGHCHVVLDMEPAQRFYRGQHLNAKNLEARATTVE
jgi:hypothetical protein